jgi:hypothetical protein
VTPDLSNKELSAVVQLKTSPCRLVERYRHFRESHCLLLQGRRMPYEKVMFTSIIKTKLGETGSNIARNSAAELMSVDSVHIGKGKRVLVLNYLSVTL